MNDEIKKIRSVYFIGIGGIGMSAIARFFHSKGTTVGGYDRSETELIKELEAEGIAIHFDENVETIPKDVDMVVYTPAVPIDHKELVFYLENGYKVVKRSDVLEMITKSSFNICIAGTHGKTTITTMIAHLLRNSGLGCNAFLGGVSVNYGTNFWDSATNICVIEADEYDRSFLKLNPDIAIITAMDADHLDIYGTADNMENAFIAFSRKVSGSGLLITRFGLKRGKELGGGSTKHISYSLQNESADVYASNVQIKDGSYLFDIHIGDEKIEQVTLDMGGMHNVENSIAAVAAVSSLEIDTEKIRAGIESFRGVKRRFEYIVRNQRIVYIDDYAHHPEELRALINGAKALFRERKCTVIFQPHLYSRTKDLADGFAEVLDLADEVILLPIYPAREIPVKGVESGMIAAKMKNEHVRILDKEKLMKWMRNDYAINANKEFGELLITAGAGDIDMLVEPIADILKKI